MSFEAIQDEYRERRIGPLILAEVERIVKRATRRLPPRAYAEIPSGARGDWTDQNVEDLVQEVVVAQLLEAGQLDYAMSHARTLPDFRALVYRSVSRQIRLRRRKTAIDGLIGRVRDVLVPPTYVLARTTHQAEYAPAGRVLSSEPITNADVYRAAQLVAALPRTQARSRAGVPLFFEAKTLRAAVATIANELPLPFGLDEVRRVLELVFADHALSTLLPSYDRANEDQEAPQMAAPGLAVADEAVVGEAVTAILADLDPEQALVLRLKSAEVSDLELGNQLGVSRPTAAKRKREMQEVLRRHLDGLDDDTQDTVLARVLIRLALAEVEQHG